MMLSKSRWGLMVGSVLVAGALVTGVALAQDQPGAPVAPAAAEKPVPWQKALDQGKLTPAEADLLKQMQALRKSYVEKMQAESQALINQAVKDGKLTQEQADRLLKRGHGLHKGPGPAGKPHMRPGKAPGQRQPLTAAEMKARLDAAVKSGKLTQEKADQILQRWQEHQAQQSQ